MYTCFAWASAYAARTIMESRYLERTDRFLTTKMAFSPLHLYHAVRDYSGAPEDQEGGSLLDTVTVMASLGSSRQTVFDEKVTANSLSPEEWLEVSTPPVTGFGILFTSNASPGYRLEQVKKNLFEGNPVIIAIMTPYSFSDARGIWSPESDERPKAANHALCVVGYDDEKYGGAFEIVNSWGEEWGNDGYMWIGYETFGQWVEQAWVLTEDTSIYDRVIEHTGKVTVKTSDKNDDLQVRLSEDGIYTLPYTLKNGSRICFSIKNEKVSGGDMYSYSFYTDAQNNRAVKFGNNEWITTDGSVKAENFVVLYSRAKLNIDALLGSFERQTGTIASRLKKIMGNNFISFAHVKYENTVMGLSADYMNEASVAAMVLSVKYDAEEKPVTEMIKIPGASFMMGSPVSEEWRNNDEKQQRVSLGGYYIGATEVTVGEFRDFVKSTGYKTSAERTGKSLYVKYSTAGSSMEERAGLSWETPAFTQEDHHPVVHVSWYDALEYCNWKSRLEGIAPVYTISGTSVRLNSKANGYRLPTEAEWEYACRAGTKTPYNTGNTIRTDQANYYDSLILKTTPVKKYAPNQWGLYDMHGNVLEWCWDTFQDDIRSIRSATWLHTQPEVRSASRNYFYASDTAIFLGFRLARSDL
ncbi:MAG: SUMF1/EgtB/PvdO family nonheme iron enzyme [Treponema sp.]|nr:SUMF1/EgtB/PvdO family nonheme iron enzyme [Treponema sp.]